jgi:hypothetical protein
MKKLLLILALLATVSAAIEYDIRLITPEDGSLFLRQGGPMSVWFSWSGGGINGWGWTLTVYDSDGEVYYQRIMYCPVIPVPPTWGCWVDISAWDEGDYTWDVISGSGWSDEWGFTLEGPGPAPVDETSWGVLKAVDW